MLDLADPELWTNPYPQIMQAREAGRTTLTRSGELVLLHADDIDRVHADAAFRMPGMEDLERVGVRDGPFYEWRKRTLPVLDGTEHLKLRFFVNSAFSPRQMQRLRELARERAHRLIDVHAAAGSMEVLRDFSNDLPLWSMCRFMGIDEDDRLQLGEEPPFEFLGHDLEESAERG